MADEVGKMTAKNVKIAAGSVSLLTALICVCCFINVNEDGDARGLWLVQRPTENIRSIDVTDHENGLAISMTADSGHWLINGEPVISERMASLLAALSYLKAAYEVNGEDALDLARFGLDEPKKSVRVEYTNHRAHTWLVGDSYQGRGAYIKEANGDGIYFIDDLRAEVIDASPRVFLEVPLNQVDFRRINGIRIASRAHGEIMLNRSESPRGGEDFFWRIYEPYFGNARKEKVGEIISTAEDCRWVRRGGGGAPDDKYGGTLTLYDAFDRELVIQVGHEKDGRVSCKIDGMGGVYEIRKDIASIFGLEPEDLVDTTLYYYEPASVMEFKLTWSGREHYFISLWEDTDDKNKKGQRLVMDSKGISSSSYHEFARALTSIKADGIYRGDEKLLGGAVGSMHIKRMSAPYEEIIEFLGIDDMKEYVGVAYNGHVLSYLRQDSIEWLMSIADALLSDD
ncbi:MAG: DUF4340 domain-containing protein [Synergistaceae bacterium]|nr:DUF4340 domain-containing protein [Synergistaceae bacterium]